MTFSELFGLEAITDNMTVENRPILIQKEKGYTYLRQLHNGKLLLKVEGDKSKQEMMALYKDGEQ